MNKKFSVHFLWWVGALCLYRILRGGMDFGQFGVEIPLWYQIVVILGVGLWLATMTLGVTYLLERERFARMSLIKILAIKALANFAGLLIVGNFIQITFLLVTGKLGEVEHKILLEIPPFWIFVLYYFIVSALFDFIEMMMMKMGQKTFFKLLLGMYRNPREEQHIFMFMDLKDSTSLAEKLGHIRYSQLIQQCFLDLNLTVAEYGGEIYQYVGDEAVIFWDQRDAGSFDRCIDCFQAFQHRLKKSEAEYMELFGVAPSFKAGVHAGTIIATEVGVIKREVAFHGDTINTAARIQGACNAYAQSLLISETIFKQLEGAMAGSMKFVGEEVLKGKQHPVGMYAME